MSLVPGNISAIPVSMTNSSQHLATKRALSDTESDADEPQSKRMKTPVASGSGESPVKDKKKKRSKKKKRKTPIVAGGMKADGAGPSTARAGTTASAPVSAAGKPLSSQGPAYETPQEPGDLLGELADAMPTVAVMESSELTTDTSKKPQHEVLEVLQRGLPTSNSPPSEVTANETGKDNTSASQTLDISITTQPLSDKTSDLSTSQPPGSLDKGKRKAVQSSPAALADEAVPNGLSARNADPGPSRSAASTSTVASSELVNKHQILISSFSQSLTCQICLELMHKPYSLTPCGHVSCHECLVSWFTAPQPGEPPRGRRSAIRRRKTCPHCRAEVRTRPAEVWVVKDMVSALVRSGLGPASAEDEAPLVAGTSTSLVHVPNSRPLPPADPWAGIFRPEGARAGWDGDDQEGVEYLGIFDVEDGVYRCLDCHHEIADGECTACGRQYDGHMDYDSDFTDGGEVQDYLEAAEDMLDELDAADLDAYMAAHRDVPWYRRGFAGDLGPDHEDEDEEDDEDSSDGTSAFDEDDDLGLGMGFGAHWVPGAMPYDIDIIEDDTDGEDNHGHGPGRGRRHFGLRRAGVPPLQAHIDEIGDEDQDAETDESYEGSFIDDEDAQPRVAAPREEVINIVSDQEDDHPPAARRIGRHYRAPIVVVSDDDDDGEDSDVQVVPMQRSRASAPILVSSDDDDSEEEEDGGEDDSDGAQGSADEVDDDGSIRRIPMRLARAGSGRRRR